MTHTDRDHVTKTKGSVPVFKVEKGQLSPTLPRDTVLSREGHCVTRVLGQRPNSGGSRLPGPPTRSNTHGK
jgi:hypothetical protein